MTQYQHKYLDVGIGAELGGHAAGVAVFVIILRWINRCFTHARRETLFLYKTVGNYVSLQYVSINNGMAYPYCLKTGEKRERKKSQLYASYLQHNTF